MEKLEKSVRDREISGVLKLWSAGGSLSKRVVESLADDGALQWADSLSAHGLQGARAAAAVLAKAAAEPDAIGSRLRALSIHPDRTVRQGAAQALGRQLTARFSDLLPVVEGWVADPEPGVRRAAVQATSVAASTGNIGWSGALLNTLAPLLSDRSPHVGRALGPGALARTYLEVFPDDTVEHLAQWSTSHDERVLWNVAMAFSGPAAGKVAGKAVIVLGRLALDDRPYVRAAVAAALRALTDHAPPVAVPKLRSWLSDEERAPVARAALRHTR
ncbi:MAG: HEAT repeat domain-containing protein [Candidatus Bipolaricaulota bacterium]